MDHTIRETILNNRAAAERELDALRAGNTLSQETLYLHLRRFILFKFQLDPEAVQTDSIAEITDLSLAKTAKLSREMAEQIDNAKACDGASSAMVKKALLLTALQRGLDVTLDKKIAVRCKTISELSVCLREALTKKGGEAAGAGSKLI